MIWIAKAPPQYVWDGDKWKNERDGKIYSADIDRHVWVSDNSELIPFPKKTRVYGK